MKTKIIFNKKNIKKWIIVISSVFVLLNCSQIVIASDITTQRMVELVNESRKKTGLSPLKVNNKLTIAAKAKADDMFKFQYFDHNSPSGVTPWHWIKSAGYNYLYAGENLAIDFVTAEGSHLALMRSITHRDNILKPNYTEVGIAVKKGIFDGNESIIIVEHFGTPLKKVEEIIIAKDIKGDADINLKEAKKVAVKKVELVEIKSPVVYFKEENYNKEEIKTEKVNLIDEDEEDEEDEEDGKDKEFVFPIMFPVENVKPLNRTLTEDIFWNNYEEEDEKIFGKITSLFDYKFLLIKVWILV